MSNRLAVVFFISLLAVRPADAATLTSQQLTSSTDGGNQAWASRLSSTSRGKILYVRTTNDTVYLLDGTTEQPVQASIANNSVEPTPMMLGSGSTAGTVTGGWRRGAGKGWVSSNGSAPVFVNLNPEHTAIVDGCAFMVLQTAADGNRAFKIDTGNGSLTALSIDTAPANKGASRVFASGCNKAVVAWQNDDGVDPREPIELKYWNGTSSTNADTGVSDVDYSFVGGKLVYVKRVGGVDQVFLIDTNVSLSPIQLTTETNPAVTLTKPQTDGRHVGWYRSSTASGSQLVLNGDVIFPTGPLGKIDANAPHFQINRGQLLWTNADIAPRSFFYDDGRQTFTIDPAPATAMIRPWLADGYIAFLGPTPTGGSDNDVFRVTGTPPADANQPAHPLIVLPTPGTGQVRWDSVLGATSYNAYVAYAPGVTKDNYLSLPGGRKIAGATSGFNVTGVPVNTTYYVAITTVEGGTEGPSSRVGSTTFVGNMTWNAVGGLGTTAFYSVAADTANASFVYAGANGSIHKSSDGGINWPQVLSNATTAASRVAALAVSGSRVFANMMPEADIWRSLDNGGNWNRVLEVTGFGETRGSLAIDPVSTNTMYAGDFIMPGRGPNDSLVIKSINGGANWTHAPEGPSPGAEIHAYSIAIDPANPSTLYAGGSGTPNISKSTNGATSWTDTPIPGNTGGVYSLAVDPTNTSIVYATTRDQGVFKSVNGGGVWTAKNVGLLGVGSTGTGFNSILVDPQNSNFLHLGAGNGYWFSVDGGENWAAANTGFGGSPANIYALTMTPGRRLIAATGTGLYMLSFAPPPVVSSVSPNSGNIGGNALVTITGTGFQSGAMVTFGGTAATGVTVVNDTRITAMSPAHSAGSVAVAVTNPDFQTGSLAAAFIYANTPNAPGSVTATAQTTNSIQLAWTPVIGATAHEIHRRAPGVPFTLLATIGAPIVTYSDTVSPGTAYAYRIRAVNGSGASADSPTDIATTVMFSNEPLTAGVFVQAAHLQQLRTAINAVQLLAGVTVSGFTDAASAGVLVRAIHLTEMRGALDPALTALTVPSGGYTDSALSGIPIKAIHFQELRNRIK